MRKMPCEVHKVSQMKLGPYLNNSWLMCSQCKLSGLPQIVGATREPWHGGLDTSRYIMHQCFFSGVKQHLMNTDSQVFFGQFFFPQILIYPFICRYICLDLVSTSRVCKILTSLVNNFKHDMIVISLWTHLCLILHSIKGVIRCPFSTRWYDYLGS